MRSSDLFSSPRPPASAARSLRTRGPGFLCLVLWCFLGLPGLALAKLKVVATMPIYAELVRAIGGDRVEVDAVAKQLQDPHFIQPTPWSVARISRADAFVGTGLDLELWAGPLLEAGANRKVFMGSPGYVDLSVGIDLLQIPMGNVTRQAGDVHMMGNPHYFYSPPELAICSATIEERFSALDPAGAETYRKNGEAWRGGLRAAENRWRAKLAPFQGRPIVPFHNSFPYIERWSGLRILDHIEPKPGINPSAAHLARLVLRMRQEGCKVVLHEPFYQASFSESVAGKTGAKVVTWYAQPGDRAQGATYVEMMDRNLDDLVAAMGGAP